ncbi:MAG: response regulator [Anaerolineae bacterium]|nr:response regulator [Anaerolineae bacterium]
MSDLESLAESEALLAQLRDALAHYYDQAYLVRHPLLDRLNISPGTDPVSAVQELRRLLAAAIQQLRPRPDTPISDPAWRPYAVLHRRYILGKELSEVESELLLGRRQVLREQRKALEAIALSLQREPSPQSVPADAGDNPLLQEISRVSSDRRGVDVAEVLQGVLGPIRTLAQGSGVRLIADEHPTSAHVFCNPALLRQLILATLSFAVRSAAGGEVNVQLVPHGRQARLRCVARLPAAPDPASRVSSPPEPVQTLAQAQRAEVTLRQDEAGFTLDLLLPSGDQEVLVALVEDNEDAVRLFTRYLAGRGFRLVPLSDSTTALPRIADLMPDVVILDLMMSNVDGWEILQQLQAEPRLHRIPIVVCSVLDEPELARSLGATAYLRKPIRATQLLDCLSEVIRDA